MGCAGLAQAAHNVVRVLAPDAVPLPTEEVGNKSLGRSVAVQHLGGFSLVLVLGVLLLHQVRTRNGSAAACARVHVLRYCGRVKIAAVSHFHQHGICPADADADVCVCVCACNGSVAVSLR